MIILIIISIIIIIIIILFINYPRGTNDASTMREFSGRLSRLIHDPWEIAHAPLASNCPPFLGNVIQDISWARLITTSRKSFFTLPYRVQEYLILSHDLQPVLELSPPLPVKLPVDRDYIDLPPRPQLHFGLHLACLYIPLPKATPAWTEPKSLFFSLQG